MAVDPITAALDIGGKLIDRLWPDPQQAAAAKLELAKMSATGELAQLTAETDLATAQLDVNRAEASNPAMFVAGWRPAVGWVGAVTLALTYWPYAIAGTVLWAWTSYKTGVIQPKPDLGAGDIVALLGSMLGIAGLRTKEKLAGVATTAVAPFKAAKQ